MGVTTDRDDPRLTHGVDETPVPQAEAYLVLSDEARARGWVRPLRAKYRHVGVAGPAYPLRDLTDDEQVTYGKYGYLKFEPYPADQAPLTGSFWTQAKLDSVGKGCGTVTSMGRELAETYAKDPTFYGATYCAGCRMHRQVAEFVWDVDGSRVGS